MCLVSPYWEYLADTLIGLAKNLGVTYFKWDAIWQNGCNSPDLDLPQSARLRQMDPISFVFDPLSAG